MNINNQLGQIIHNYLFMNELISSTLKNNFVNNNLLFPFLTSNKIEDKAKDLSFSPLNSYLNLIDYLYKKSKPPLQVQYIHSFEINAKTRSNLTKLKRNRTSKKLENTFVNKNDINKDFCNQKITNLLFREKTKDNIIYFFYCSKMYKNIIVYLNCHDRKCKAKAKYNLKTKEVLLLTKHTTNHEGFSYISDGSHSSTIKIVKYMIQNPNIIAIEINRSKYNVLDNITIINKSNNNNFIIQKNVKVTEIRSACNNNGKTNTEREN